MKTIHNNANAINNEDNQTKCSDELKFESIIVCTAYDERENFKPINYEGCTKYNSVTTRNNSQIEKNQVK